MSSNDSKVWSSKRTRSRLMGYRMHNLEGSVWGTLSACQEAANLGTYFLAFLEISMYMSLRGLSGSLPSTTNVVILLVYSNLDFLQLLFGLL